MPCKPRLSRMDAAVDAMAALGFPAARVRKCAKELLKVYGGADSWRFIEEYSYKELIESLLREDGEEIVHTDINIGKESTSQKCGEVVVHTDINAEKASTSQQKPRKGHCYGWIDDDDEEEAALGDFLSLKPMAEVETSRGKWSHSLEKKA